MGNLWTLDENSRKFKILFAGCQKFLGIQRIIRDLAKFAHWTMQKNLGIRGKFTDA